MAEDYVIPLRCLHLALEIRWDHGVTGCYCERERGHEGPHWAVCGDETWTIQAKEEPPSKTMSGYIHLEAEA